MPSTDPVEAQHAYWRRDEWLPEHIVDTCCDEPRDALIHTLGDGDLDLDLATDELRVTRD